MLLSDPVLVGCSVASALTGKVASLGSKANIGMVWYRQSCAAFKIVKESKSVIISVISAIMTETQVTKIAGNLETKYKTVKV